MKKAHSDHTTPSAGTRALLGAVSTLAIALGVVVDGSAAANEQPLTAAPTQDGAPSARDAHSVGVLIASRLKLDSAQHKTQAVELKTQSDQHKTQAGFLKLESGRFKTEGHQLKYESHQDKWTPADSSHKLNPQPLPPGMKPPPEDQQ